MSQYPSPYTPPPVPPNYGYDFSYYQSPDDLLTPARRAGVMMFVIGGLLALGGLCCGAVGAMAPLDQVISQNPTLSGTPGMSAELLQMGAIVLGVLALLFGMTMLILGYFVRGGGMWPVISAIIIVGLGVLAGGLIIVSGAVQSRGSGPEMLGVCLYAVPLVMLIVLLVMLFQAARAAPRVAMMKNQYQQQLWQYQQQQQMYQGGYVAPPMVPMQPPQQAPGQDSALPPLPPPMPSPPRDDRSDGGSGSA